MISSAIKIPVLRYFLIILLFVFLFAGVLYLYLHFKKTQKIHADIESLITARENSALVDNCIINLYSADNNSRLYTLTGNKLYLKKYTADINNIKSGINQIKLVKEDSAAFPVEKFKLLLSQKTKETGNYIKLRQLTDNMIKHPASAKPQHNTAAAEPKSEVKVEHITLIDTVKPQQAAAPRKKLFGRIFAAFASKKEAPKAKPIIVKKDTTITKVVVNIHNHFQKPSYKIFYKNLNVANNQLRTNEQQILLTNNNLIQQIIGSLKQYKASEGIYINKSKAALNSNMQSVFYQFTNISAINIFFLVMLVTLVFYNIWKIFRNDQYLVNYSEKTEQYAQSKGRFLAGMSHEIRTPLNSVIGFSEQLSQEDLSPLQREQVDAIRTSSEMLLELVNEILDFSKYETGKMNFDAAPFMPAQAIEEIFMGMNVQALKKNILLENKINIDENICCEGDKMRLKQVIMNLVGNAIKFTLKGKVTLTATMENHGGDNLMLKVAIRDTGLGIEKNDLPNIFEEFSQVATAQRATRHKGTGLGLPICKKIIELQGGRISVDSAPGLGSTFSFELPLKQCEPTALEDIQEMSDELMADLVKDQYVLFAEDNKLNVLLGTTILKKWKIRYDVAYNGHDALMLFEQNNYDQVLTDIQMPELNGLELTELIRNHPDSEKKHIPIMALTANVMKEDKDLYLKTGINDVILKPFLEKNLIEKVALAVQNNISVMKFVS
jgi:signal transduction histidine kinase/CHASE3 domain sensor protein